MYVLKLLQALQTQQMRQVRQVQQILLAKSRETIDTATKVC
jgi:hypothetical protein